MRELQLDLPTGSGRRTAVERALRDAIRLGRLAAGSALPSSRVLAADLGCSRSTVVAAYEQLTSEGFLVARQGRGTVVADVAVQRADTPDDNPMGPPPRWDFRPGEPDASGFPRREWARLHRRVLLDAPDELFGYPDPRGRIELRTALSDHLARSRSVLAAPAGVTIVGGYAAGLGFIAEVLRRAGIDRVAVEAGMLPFHRWVLYTAGLTVDTIPVDDAGIDVEALARCGARAVVVTPANQYPYGVTLSPERRAAIVEWAEANDAWIVEDDYDGEFRYDRRPIGALQGLAPDRVVYAGTASKSLAAGLRLGWLVVPERLRGDVLEVVGVRAGVSSIDQLVLARFIEAGSIDRHIRAMRRRYLSRRDALVDRLARDVPSLDIVRPAAGLHLLARLPSKGSEEQVVAGAAEAGVGLLGLRTDHRVRGTDDALVLGFSRPSQHEFAEGLDRLVAALGPFV